MEKLSAVIITYNEEEHLQTCLTSLKDVADEIVVLDSFSTDKTKEICLDAGVRFHEHIFDGYVKQKNRALKLAQYDLVLSLDGDEALSSEANNKILQIKENRSADAYLFNRKNNYCGKWMEFTSLYPDRKIRLFDKAKALWDGYDPHDHIKILDEAIVIKTESDILHWVYKSKEDHMEKAEKFATIASQSYFDRSKKSYPSQKYLHALWRFLYEYIIRAGILEGKLGLQFSLISSSYVFKKYSKLEVLYAKRSK
jgi:glycosyltransferase involved in cell wall biosynthesis